MKTKKKYGLFNVLLVILLLVIVATYFVKGRDGNISYLPVFDVFTNYIQSFYYFFDTAIFILVVGGLYGALNKVPSYKKLVKSIADKVSNKKELFIIVTTIVFALVASLTGLNMLLLIFVPFVVSIILLLGYDKLVALSSTVLSIMVGFIGGIFVTLKDASDQYSSSYATFDKIVGLDNNIGNIFPKILLLVVAVGLLIFFIIKHIKKLENGEVKNEISNNDVFLVEPRDKAGKKIKEVNTNAKVWPLIVMSVILFVLLVLGYMPWNSLFKIDVFNDFHKWLTGLKIGNYQVFTSLISSNFTALGDWGSLGSFMMAIVLIAVFLIILKYVSKVKYRDLMDGFVYGIKKMIPAVMLAMLAYAVLVCVYNNGFMETVISGATDKFGDNVVMGALLSVVGSILHVDCYYSVAGTFSPIVSGLTDKANLNVYAVMFQSLYGLVQIVGPTSLLLIVGLSYLEVPYGKWLKYVWRFVVELFIVIFIVLMIVSLL